MAIPENKYKNKMKKKVSLFNINRFYVAQIFLFLMVIRSNKITFVSFYHNILSDGSFNRYRYVCGTLMMGGEKESLVNLGLTILELELNKTLRQYLVTKSGFSLLHERGKMN